ncbi:MAG: response regulator [Segetibacter sp.]|nr:response regulator [Segetibacter sp.]
MIKILLAEDDRDDLHIFNSALEDLQEPFELRNARNGKVLFELLEESVPDFLFLDILMPFKDGLECIREIRQNSKYDKLPIIIISSGKSNENIDASYSNSANFYLFKQYSIQALSNKLKYIFSIDWKNMNYYPTKSKFILE